MLAEFSKMFVVRRDKCASGGRFFEWPAWGSKKTFLLKLHFCSVLLLSSEKLFFWYQACKVLFDFESTLKMRSGSFLPRHFGPKIVCTCIFTRFYAFFHKITDRFRSQFATRWVAIFWATKSPQMQMQHADLQFGVKKDLAAKSLVFGGRGGWKPQDNQQFPQTCIFAYEAFLLVPRKGV